MSPLRLLDDTKRRSNCDPSLPPILFRLSLHGGCVRVLHLEPVGRAAGAVGRVLPLGDDALQAELAGVAEDGLAVALDVLVPSQARPHLDQQGSQRGLADIERLSPEIVAVQFDQVESVQEHPAIVTPIPNAVEHREAVIVAAHRLAIEDTRPGTQVSQRLDNQLEAVGQVVAGAAVEPHLGAVLARDEAESVVLDFMQPQPARRQRGGLGREAGLNGSGRKGTLTQQHVGVIGQRMTRCETDNLSRVW
jgi:hypothetical protein